MAIAFDKATDFGSVSAVSPHTETHTPVGTPAGILVFPLMLEGAGTITAVTYGGVALSQLAGMPSDKGTGEISSVDAWFLGDASAIAGRSGDVVSVAFSSGSYTAVSYTVTATDDVEFNNLATYVADTAESPINETLTLGSTSSFVAEGWGSGKVDVTTGVTPLTNWTSDFAEDMGARGVGAYHYDIIGTADVTYGYTADADDANVVAVAINEVGGVTTSDVNYTGINRGILRGMARKIG